MINNLETYGKLIGYGLDSGLLTSLENLERSKMLSAMSPYYSGEDIPDELNYILVELVIYRFNKIGSEGMTSESKTNGSEVYDPKYEERLLQVCLDYAKDKYGPDSSPWKVKVL